MHCGSWKRVVALGGMFLAAAAQAQSVVRWTTNYYRVTGLSAREIRQSIDQARPWRPRNEFDAMTSWTVTWSFSVTPSGEGCQVGAVRTVATIATTMPMLVPATNRPVELWQRWARYYAALARHEAEHASIAKAAAAEIQARLSAGGGGGDCATVRRELQAVAESILDRHRREDQAMDQRTRHGAGDGARFP